MKNKKFKDYLDTQDLKKTQANPPQAKKNFKDYLENNQVIEKSLLPREKDIEDKFIIAINDGEIQYRTLLENNWKTLISKDFFLGEGKEIEISILENQLVWNYIDSEDTHFLIDLKSLGKLEGTQEEGVRFLPFSDFSESSSFLTYTPKKAINSDQIHSIEGLVELIEGSTKDKKAQLTFNLDSLEEKEAEIKDISPEVIPLEGEKGEKGVLGERGKQGKRGKQGEEGEKGEKGKDGREIEVRNYGNQNIIEWKYKKEKKWKFLLDLSKATNELMIGPSGLDGRNGNDGRNIEMQVDVDNNLEYRLMGSSIWITLIDLDDLTGGVPPGEGITIADDGIELGSGISKIDFITDGLVEVSGNVATVVLGEEMKYTKLIDFVEDYIYVGEASAGSIESGSVWRISRTYIDPVNEDIDIKWASGTIDFDKQYSEHLVYSYS